MDYPTAGSLCGLSGEDGRWAVYGEGFVHATPGWSIAGTYFGVLWSPMTRTQRWASGLYRPYPLVHKEGD